MPAQPDFTDVMTGLTGIRLAAWDELAERGDAATEQLAAWLHPRYTVAQAIEALGWLMANRLVCLNKGANRWSAVPVAKAQQVYGEYGPIVDPTARLQRPMPSFDAGPQLKMPEQPKGAVHSHQVQFELVA